MCVQGSLNILSHGYACIQFWFFYYLCVGADIFSLFGVKHGESMGFYWSSPALETCTDDFHNGASMAGIIKESFPQFSLFISLSLWRKRHQQIPSSYKARTLPELAPDD